MRKITHLGIDNLKPRARRYEKPLGEALYIIVQPSGRKRYAVRYRFAGVQRKLTLQPGISLAAARKLTADAMLEVEQGRDPILAKRQQQQEQHRTTADTLAAVCDEYLKREGGKLRSAKVRRSVLDRLVLPTLGSVPVGAIRRLDLTRLFDKIEEERGIAAADNVLALLRKIFNWHAVRDDAFKTPIVRGMARRNPKEHERRRFLSDDELRAVWKAAEADVGLFGPLVQFLLLTSARLREASELKWSELQGDDWILPPSRNKTKLELVRPLSAAAMAVLNKLPRDGEYVFSTDGRRPIGGIEHRKKNLDAQSGVRGWVLHDCRRTARTLMSRAGVDVDHAERCLGHVISGVRAVYDRHGFHKEKKAAFEALARQLDIIVNPPAANVRQLKRR